VVYTRSNAEKKLQERLYEHGFETCLPLRRVSRQWSDRTKIIHEPLFKSYLFVRSDLNGLNVVKQQPGFGHFLRFGGYPVIVPSQQLKRIKAVLSTCSEATAIASKFVKGDNVTIIEGPLKNTSGRLAEFNGQKKVAIAVNELEQSMLVSLPLAWIRKRRN
jgi:transcription antitermination factor NusG